MNDILAAFAMKNSPLPPLPKEFACTNGMWGYYTADQMQAYAQQALTALSELEAMAGSQEPVAWRTFDGEGGYDYRTYDENEDYADEWDKRNPNHKGWVEPLYAAPVAQQPQADQSLRQDALQSLAYANGAKAGWNLAVADDEAGFSKIMDQVPEAVRTLKQTRAEQPQAEAKAWHHVWGCRANAFGECNKGCKPPQQAEAVPPGYVLVPVEPTDEMLRAIRRQRSGARIGKGDRADWKVWIAAAIAQQKGSVA